jgi:adenosylcobinamide kinase / adenosylcobinamide-phosphate guanylyltransferase
MALSLLLGGDGSGKYELAVRLASRSGRPVVVLVTAEPRDEEMAARIARHRARRPEDWRTVEASLDLASALDGVSEEACLIVDCLTLWVSNLMERGDADSAIEGTAQSVATAAASRRAPTIVVSNEVGSGIVPTSPLARRFRDVLGAVNAIWAAAADRTVLVVAGRVLPLKGPEAVVE